MIIIGEKINGSIPSLQKRSRKETLNLLKQEQSFRRKAELLILTVALCSGSGRSGNIEMDDRLYSGSDSLPISVDSPSADVLTKSL